MALQTISILLWALGCPSSAAAGKRRSCTTRNLSHVSTHTFHRQDLPKAYASPASTRRATQAAYSSYRDGHARIREMVDKADLDLIDRYLKPPDWRVRGNSNSRAGNRPFPAWRYLFVKGILDKLYSAIT